MANGENDEAIALEMSAPGGIKGRATWTGSDTKVVLLAVLIAVCFAVAGYAYIQDQKTNDEARKQYLDQHKITQGILNSVIVNQKAILDSIAETKKLSAEQTGEVVYVLALPESKRQALRLEMPYSMRKRLNGRD